MKAMDITSDTAIICSSSSSCIQCSAVDGNHTSSVDLGNMTTTAMSVTGSTDTVMSAMGAAYSITRLLSGLGWLDWWMDALSK